MIEDGKESYLLITEIEKAFGFPESYTDGPNLSVPERRQLLGRAWCTFTFSDVLRPLRALFKTTDSLGKNYV